MEKYYQDLLVSNTKVVNCTENGHVELETNKKDSGLHSAPVPEKWKGQIEKVSDKLFALLNCCILFLLCNVLCASLSLCYHFTCVGFTTHISRSSCSG